MNYKKILLAVDFHDDNEQIINAALSMVEKSEGAELLLVHVHEPIGMAYSAEGFAWNDQVLMLEATVREESRNKMLALASKLNVASERCFVPDGKAASEIHALCEEQGVDLIVIGTHGQSGLRLLLGSTANSVLHGATCDVLTIRVRE